MRKDDLVRLRHMAEAAREAISFAEGRERSELDTGRMRGVSRKAYTHVLRPSDEGIKRLTFLHRLIP